MSVIRVHHEKNFVILEKKFLENMNLSLKAKGLLAFCLGKPDDWQFSVDNLCNTLKEKKTAIYSAIKELIQEGFCVKHQRKNEAGQFVSFDYVMYERSQFQINFPQSGFPFTGNQPLLNNKEELREEKEKQEKEKPFKPIDLGPLMAIEPVKESVDDSLPFSFSKKDWKKIYDSVKQLVSSMEEFRKIALYMHESDFWSARIHKPEDVIKHFKTAAGQALDEIRKQEIIQKRKQYAASRAFDGPNGGCFVDDEKISFISGQVTKTYSFKADNEFWNSQGLGFRQK